MREFERRIGKESRALFFTDALANSALSSPILSLSQASRKDRCASQCCLALIMPHNTCSDAIMSLDPADPLLPQTATHGCKAILVAYSDYFRKG